MIHSPITNMTELLHSPNQQTVGNPPNSSPVPNYFTLFQLFKVTKSNKVRVLVGVRVWLRFGVTVRVSNKFTFMVSINPNPNPTLIFETHPFQCFHSYVVLQKMQTYIVCEQEGEIIWTRVRRIAQFCDKVGFWLTKTTAYRIKVSSG